MKKEFHQKLKSAAKRLLAGGAVVLILSGCLYSNVKLPLDIDMNSTTVGSKVGTSSTRSILWLVPWGDGSTATAAKNGDIHTINLLDEQWYTILFGLYSKHTVIAYGD